MYDVFAGGGGVKRVRIQLICYPIRKEFARMDEVCISNLKSTIIRLGSEYFLYLSRSKYVCGCFST
jgi:hypothetical protein